jgi:hypothetical protein
VSDIDGERVGAPLGSQAGMKRRAILGRHAGRQCDQLRDARRSVNGMPSGDRNQVIEHAFVNLRIGRRRRRAGSTMSDGIGLLDGEGRPPLADTPVLRLDA